MVPRWIRSASLSSETSPSLCSPPPPLPPPPPQKSQAHLYNRENLKESLHAFSSSSEMVTSFLNLCRKRHIQDLSTTHLVYTYTIYRGIHFNFVLGETLLLSLAKCGAIEDALYLLHHCLQQKSIFAWTAIISAYVGLGKPLEALESYDYMMVKDGMEPDLYTFVTLFKACGDITNLKKGRTLHIYAEKKGYTSDSFIACSLVNMYGKCRSIKESEKVFLEIGHPDMPSWSAMLSAYLDDGQGAKAIMLYRQILAEDQGTFEPLLILALKACGCLAEESGACSHGKEFIHEISRACSHRKAMISLNIGQALHSQASVSVSHNVFLSSALVSMYGKCGAISYAENAFLQLPQHDDVILWNSMLSVYVEHDLAIKALWLYKKMHEEGMPAVSKQTITIALRACQHLSAQMEPDKFLNLVYAFCDDIVKKNLVSNPSIGGAFVNLLGKCERIEDAESIFGGLSRHEILSWTEMVSAYVENGHPDKALQLYGKIARNDVSPDQHTIAITIQACNIRLEIEDSTFLEKDVILEIGHALHAKARKHHFVSNVYISSSLITMYGKCGHTRQAENLFFTRSTTHNVVTWTSMLSVYLEQGRECTALRFYHEMQKEGISPDEHALMVAFQACAKIGEEKASELVVIEGRSSKSVALEIGKGLHADADRMGFTSDILVTSTLLNMYGKCGDLMEAEMVFNTVSHENNVSLFTAILSVYVEQGRGDKALQLYANQRTNILFDDVIAICILKACSLTANLEVCRQIHFGIVSTGISRVKSLINTALYAYGCCASMVDAMVVMDGLPRPDIVSWNSCIGTNGENTMTSLCMFETMLLSGIEPDEITFLLVLSTFSHIGLLEKGIECFESMKEKYCLVPNKKHYVAFVDLVGRTGSLDWLKDFINMHVLINSDVLSWICLLSACDRHGDVELGKYVFDRVLDLEPDETVAYVLMSNIYAYVID